MDEILKTLSDKLQITVFELRKMIKQLLDKETYQEELLELFGYENIEYIEKICENKMLFKESEENGETYKYYVEYILPEFKTIKVDDKLLIPVSCTGDDSKYFEYERFNPVQSEVYSCAYESDSNFMVCAPTGSGKTDIALLSVLRALKKDNAKVIYIVPMKALAHEITYKYKIKLKNYKIIEFTGDTEIPNKELVSSDVIICTPEKFDAYTRKLNNIFQNFLNLVVIDEIHMLQDDRGSVLEAIVARMFRYVELKQRHIRIVGLSATLPNYEDIGTFLKTEKVFNFDQKYRPVPLKTSLIGIFENATRKQSEELFVERVESLRSNKKQVLVFVNSRHDTINTAKLLINPIYTADLDKKCRLNDILEHLLTLRLGVHHAGLPRNIRIYMENKFKKGEIDILVCTSTLAWGVNLPAHAVIIKGTTFYDPNIGKFRDLGILDIYQIFGRAGRPQYKIKGEAILITEYKKVGQYLKMIKNNQDIESRLLCHVANVINSEIYLNNINNITDGISWFKNTFMYVRLKKNPSIYGLLEKDIDDEDTALSEYIYLTITRLEECKLININRKSSDTYTCWDFNSTEFGRIASFYYLDHESIYNWLKNIDFLSNEDDVIKLILKNNDFCNIQLKKDEEYNLLEMSANLDLNIDKLEDYKLFVLTHAYLRNYPVTNFALKCDLLFIAKNLERILNAFLEFLAYLKRWNILLISLNIFRRFKPKIYKPVQDSVFSITCYECGDFIDFRIVSNNSNHFWIIFYDQNVPVFITKGVKQFSTFIKKTIDKLLNIEILDSTNNKIYNRNVPVETNSSIEYFLETGYHFCKEDNKNLYLLDSEDECKHVKLVDGVIAKRVDNGKLILSVKFSSKIEFVISNVGTYQEFIRQFINISLHYIKQDCPVLIICKRKKDYAFLSQELRTRLAIYNYQSGKSIHKKIINDTKKISHNSICIVTIEEAISCDKNVFVIFLSCQDNENKFYPVLDILQISNRRNVVIYESESFVEFFRKSVLKIKS